MTKPGLDDSAARRVLVRTFAVSATLLMLLVVADSAVVRAASTDPTVAPHGTTDSGLAPPPVISPPTPPDEPQRPVEPGTVTQGWENASLVSSIADHSEPRLVQNENELRYETSYGNFFLSKDSPYFVGVGDPTGENKIAESAFLVLFQGQLLSPAKGVVGVATSGELSFHYRLYLAGALHGTMSVDYLFQTDKNKITVSFRPAVPALSDQYQIVWLTFTTLGVVDTMFMDDIEQRFDDIVDAPFHPRIFETLVDIGAPTFPGANIRDRKVAGSPDWPTGGDLRMDASDAASDFGTTFAGTFAFGGYSGNAVLATFRPGHLAIDPQLVQSSVSDHATAYSIQRKTFYDGSRYWVFYQKDSTTVYYLNSLDGKNWNPPSPGTVAFKAGSGGSFPYGFTIISYGKTIGGLWTDGSDPTRIFISNGVTTDYIATVSRTINDGKWHFLAGTYDGTTIAIYVDGVLDNSKPSSIGSLQTSAKGTTLAVGQESSKTGIAPMVGSVDDVRVFNLALDAVSISSLWRFNYKLLTSSSVAYDDAYPTSVTAYDGVSTPRELFFNMETCIVIPCASSGSMEDLSGHGRDGVLTGTSNNSSGKIGAARTFGGNTDRIQAPNINVGKSFSVSLWVNPTSGQTDSEAVLVKEDGAFSVMMLSTRFVKAYFYDGVAWQPLGSNSSLPAGSWSHVTVTYSQTGTSTIIAIYINGALSGGNVGTLPGSVASSTSPVMLGGLDGVIQRFLGSEDEVHIVSRVLSMTEVSSLYNGYTSGSVSFDTSHMSRTYMDGLGRATRSVAMDMYGNRIQTFTVLASNDQPVYSYIPSGGYSTFSYDFLGRTLTAQTPGDSMTSGISSAIFSEKARMVESVDAVGRKVYSKTDLLGRTVETAVWNPATSSYGNQTKIMYNALSEVNWSKDANGKITTVYYNSLGKPKMTVFPDSTDADKRYSTVYYDDNLRAYTAVDVMGRASVSAYDYTGRVISVTLKPTLSTVCPTNCYSVAYVYDPVHDDLQTIDNGTAKITRFYDSLHRMTQETLQIPPSGSEFSKWYTIQYDNAGKLTDIMYPTGEHAIYKYDSLGRTQEVDYANSKVAVFNYDAFGRLGNIHYWKGATDTFIQESYVYDVRDRVTQIKVYNTNSGTVYVQQDYTSYSKASEILAATDNMYDSGGASNPKTVTYGYDGNGRLASAHGPFGNSSDQYQCYAYDAVGNIASEKISGTGTPTSCTNGISPVVYTYNYGASPAWNRLDSITPNFVSSFTYNVAGSVLTKVEGSTTTYTHDFLQQLVKVVASSGTYTYSYDGLGRRIKTIDPFQTTYFMYLGDKMMYSKVGTSGTETVYVYVGNRLLFKKNDYIGDVKFYHFDLSSNVRLITYYTSSVQVDAKYRYQPFGDKIILFGSLQGFQFAGQDYDDTIRLYHMGARYYDPRVGRFIERDPIGPGYSYANNNPMSFSDPTGLATEGTPWQNFLNWLGSSQGRMVVGLVSAALTASFIFSLASLTTDALVAGLIVGIIFMAGEAVISGGKATAEDYIAAFSLGFVVGTVIAGVAGFGVDAAELGAAKPSLSGVASKTRAIETTEAEEFSSLSSRGGEFRGYTYRTHPKEAWRPDLPPYEEGRAINYRIASVRRGSETEYNLVKGTTPPANPSRSQVYLGSIREDIELHPSLYESETTRIDREILQTDLHESLHRVVGQEVLASGSEQELRIWFATHGGEDTIDELSRWLVTDFGGF